MCFISSSIYSSSSSYYFASIVLYIITRKLIDLAQFIIYTCLFCLYIQYDSSSTPCARIGDAVRSVLMQAGGFRLDVDWSSLDDGITKQRFMFDGLRMCVHYIQSNQQSYCQQFSFLFIFSFPFISVHHHQSFTDLLAKLSFSFVSRGAETIVVVVVVIVVVVRLISMHPRWWGYAGRLRCRLNTVQFCCVIRLGQW